jgi:hypothetical protein
MGESFDLSRFSSSIKTSFQKYIKNPNPRLCGKSIDGGFFTYVIAISEINTVLKSY